MTSESTCASARCQPSKPGTGNYNSQRVYILLQDLDSTHRHIAMLQLKPHLSDFDKHFRLANRCRVRREDLIVITNTARPALTSEDELHTWYDIQQMLRVAKRQFSVVTDALFAAEKSVRRGIDIKIVQEVFSASAALAFETHKAAATPAQDGDTCGGRGQDLSPPREVFTASAKSKQLPLLTTAEQPSKDSVHPKAVALHRLVTALFSCW
mmetsp:Transcript_2031/g.3166  ORF Transcript_2031/g.3166 Transcript_2031/m.3166 type:complete len:211 (-) Transcript_2031:374-1006(-)